MDTVIFISEENVKKLSEEVNNKIKFGYSLKGNVVCTVTVADSYRYFWYVQCMILNSAGE